MHLIQTKFCSYVKLTKFALIQVKREISQMFSNKKKLLILGLLFWLIKAPLFSQETPASKQAFDSINQVVSNALMNADIPMISSTFNDKIDLTLLDKQGLYSNSQAQFIISGFFKKFDIQSYQIVSQNYENNSDLVVGKMQTADALYKVCYLIKLENNKFKIYQFRVEK